MRKFEPGDILLAHYPFTDHSSTKLRPIVVVSEPRWCEGADFVALPISSNVRSDDLFGFVVSERASEFRATGLKITSTIKWTKPMTLTNSIVTRRLGRLSDDAMRSIRKRLSQLLGYSSEGPGLFESRT